MDAAPCSAPPLSPPSPCRIVQARPYDTCGRLLPGARPLGPRCRNPRCSRDCRTAWAEKEWRTNERTLTEARDAGRWIGFGTLKLQCDFPAAGHAATVKGFQRLLRRELDRRGIDAKVRLYLDFGRVNRRLHWHILVNAASPVSHDLISECWSKACCGLPTAVHIGPIRDLRAAVKYAVKVDQADAPLLERRIGLNVVYGSRGWFGEGGQAAVWAELRREWFGEPAAVPDQGGGSLNSLGDEPAHDEEVPTRTDEHVGELTYHPTLINEGPPSPNELKDTLRFLGLSGPCPPRNYRDPTPPPAVGRSPPRRPAPRFWKEAFLSSEV